jgi:hypothetical protein
MESFSNNWKLVSVLAHINDDLEQINDEKTQINDDMEQINDDK